jgi:hypothetical protein
VIHYYHCCKIGAWRRIRDEHLATLKAAGYDGAIHVNEVGNGIMEDATLKQIWNFAHIVPPETPIFYAHGKGSYRPSPVQEEWRRMMDSWLATDWRNRVKELEHADVATWHWYPPSTAPIPELYLSLPMWHGTRTIPYGFCTGNFWWATAGYIAGLEEPVLPPGRMRFMTERWIGLDNPVVTAQHRPEWPRAQQLLGV